MALYFTDGYVVACVDVLQLTHGAVATVSTLVLSLLTPLQLFHVLGRSFPDFSCSDPLVV